MIRIVSLVLLSLALAGCGGSSSRAGAGEGAEIAPASAVAYAVIHTDADGDAWKAAQGLLERFPGIEASLERELDGLDLREDVLAAAGDEAEVVVLKDGRRQVPVVLVWPESDEDLERVLSKLDPRPVTRELEGATAIAKRAADIDLLERRSEAEGPLSEVESFRGALDDAPEDALATVWAAPDGDRGVAHGSVVPEEDGLRVEGVAAMASLDLEAYESELVNEAPADAVAFVSFRGGDSGAAMPYLEQLGELVGVEPSRLAALLGGEGALIVRRGGLVPEVTLLLDVEDGADAVATLDEAIAQFAKPERVRIGGLDARRLRLGIVDVLYAERDGRLVVTTAEAALTRSEGGLADAPAFRDAVEAAGMPDRTAGFAFVDVERALPLLTMLGGGLSLEMPQDVERDLRQLRTLVAFAAPEEGRVRFGARLALEER